MSALARWIARWLWWWMLWWMRRPSMRRIQMASIRWLPEERRAKAMESFKRQNRFARRIGLPVLVVTVNIALASIALTIAFRLILAWFESGLLEVPSREAVGYPLRPHEPALRFDFSLSRHPQRDG